MRGGHVDLLPRSDRELLSGLAGPGSTRRPTAVLVAAGWTATVALGGCGGPSASGDGPETAMEDSMSARSIEETLEARTGAWMSLAGVEGTGIGRCDGEPCIKVFVRTVTDELRAAIPDTVEGHPVRLEATRRFEAREPTDTAGGDGP